MSKSNSEQTKKKSKTSDVINKDIRFKTPTNPPPATDSKNNK